MNDKIERSRKKKGIIKKKTIGKLKKVKRNKLDKETKTGEKV